MSDAPEMPHQIWVYSKWADNADNGEWDQSDEPDCGHDWPHARYTRADLPPTLAELKGGTNGTKQ